MALLFVEGMDLYSNTTTGGFPMNTVWSLDGTAAQVAGRFTGKALSYGGAGTNNQRLTVSTASASMTVGFAMKVSSIPGADQHVLKFDESGPTTQASLIITAAGKVAAYRGDAANLLGTSTAQVIFPGAWHYVEVELTISATVGVFNVYVDGIQVITLAAQNTKAGTSTSITSLCWVNPGNLTTTIDDIYFTDTAARLGEMKVETIRSNGNTATDDWSKLSGTSATAMLGETLADGDTSYIFDSTVGHKTLQDLADLAATPSAIAAVQTCWIGRKDDATTRQVRGFNKSGATTTNGATKNVTTSYVKYNDVYETDPNTGLPWTGANVNALQVGVEVIA